ncbi:MAG TPA: histidine kinase [Bacteroidia bacterium]|nr:histidine kinase [Bacteroidia bacterium]
MLVFSATAQSPTYINYTTYDGLPSQVTYCVMQDSKGFIWIGTENGLCRFDGRNFKTYTTDDGLPDNEVLKIAEDKLGRLWLTLFNGGACYMKDGKFYWSKNESALAKIKPIKNFVGYYFPEGESGFYIYGDKHLYYLDYNLNVKNYYDNFLFGRSTTIGDSDPNIIFSSDKITKLKSGKIVKEININLSLEAYRIQCYSSRFSYNKMFYFLKEEQKLVIAQLDELHLLKNTFNVSFNYNFSNIKNVNSYYYIMTLSNVLLRYKETDKSFSKPEVYISGATFNDIILDKEGGIWITSLDKGLYYIPKEAAKNYSIDNGLAENSIYEIFEMNNKIHFADHKGNIYSALPLKKQASLNDGKEVNRVLSSTLYSNKLYLATDRGVKLFDTSYQNIGAFLPIYSTKDLVINNDTVYWVHLGGIFKTHTLNSSYIDTLITGRKTTIAVDNSNRIWYGELNGCFILTAGKKILSLGDKYPILKTRVTAIRKASDGIMWIATQANGLVGMLNDTICFHFTKQSGLSTNNIKSIFIDGSKIVTATDKGVDIIEYNLKNKQTTITNIDKFKGLADNDVNRVFLKNDTLYAGTAQGFSIVPLKTKSPNVPPTVYLTGFTINNIDTFFTSVFALPHWKNNIIISYAAISFSSGDNIKYRYRLNHFSPHTYTSDNSVTLAELAPGNYQFEVEAQNINGTWSAKPAVIAFAIEPPFWKRLRFLWGASFIAAGVIALVYYYRLKKYRTELQLQNRMVQSEIKALRAQMNPHFIFNSLNSIQQFIFTNKKEEANEYLSEFAKLMRMMLDHSKENFIAISEELEFIKLYLKLEKHRLANRFNYEINFNNEEKISPCYIPSMVLQPFIENAIVHGLSPKPVDGLLQIKFDLISNNLKCSITDNGVGRKNLSESIAHKHSFAIKATQDRINAINAAHLTKVNFKIIDLTDTLNQPSGTLIEINFPDIKTL